MSERDEIEQTIARLERQRAQLGDAVVDTAVSALRDKLLKMKDRRSSRESGEFAAMRKQVTVLFSDLVGYTALSETMDPEDLRAVMNAYFKEVTEAITSFGGTIEKLIGDAVMAVWGVPTSGERDPENAVRAALAMRSALEGLNEGRLKRRGVRLAQRIGIDTGLVFATSREGENLRVVGNTVEVAGCLEQAAPAGGILLSRETYRHVRGVFDVVEQRPIAVKGSSEPLLAYLVEREKPRAFRLPVRGVEGIETPTVGRDEELARLQALFQEVVATRSLRLVTLVGDAGVGKTRLLFEFTKWLELRPERIRLFKGRADRPSVHVPYALIRDVFGFRLEIHDDDSPAEAHAKLERGVARYMGEGSQQTAHFIGHLLGFDFSHSPHLKGILGDAKQVRDRAFHATAQLFRAVAAEVSATALFLEDVYWADDGSLDLVHYLARECRDVPLLILCLARPDLLERRRDWVEERQGWVRLDLKPLSREASRCLVSEILCNLPAVPPELEGLVVRQAEGYPLYVEEFIKMLIEEGVIVKKASEWQVARGRLSQLRVPPTLTGILQARLDALPKDERVTLQMAAIVGRVFWDGVLREVAEKSKAGTGKEIPNLIQALCAKELVFQRTTTTFGRSREYVFKHALLHEVTYESVPRRVRVPYHAQVAAWLQNESGVRAPQFAELIGEHLRLADRPEEAGVWFEKAARRAKETYAQPAAARFYGLALDSLPAKPAASSLRRQAHMLEELGEVLVLQAQYASAAETFQKMLGVAVKLSDASLRARAWNGLSWAQDRLGDYAGALDSAVRAEEIARQSGARAELARALFRRGWALFRMGQAKAVLDIGGQALALSEELEGRRDVAFSLKLLGIAHMLAGDFAGARSFQEKALGLFEAMGDQWGVANLLNNLGETARLQGDYDTAMEIYEREMRILREIGNRDGEIICFNNLGATKTALGRFREAEPDLLAAVELSESLGNPPLSETIRFLAEASLGLGRSKKALGFANRALDVARRSGSEEDVGGAFRALGLVAAASGPVRGADGEVLDAAACFSESMKHYEAAGAEADRLRALREWARYELARGNREHGLRLRRELLESFERLGLTLEVERSRRLLPA